TTRSTCAAQEKHLVIESTLSTFDTSNSWRRIGQTASVPLRASLVADRMTRSLLALGAFGLLLSDGEDKKYRRQIHYDLSGRRAKTKFWCRGLGMDRTFVRSI